MTIFFLLILYLIYNTHMASFLDADGIKALLPMPSATTNAITMTSAAQTLTPSPSQLQPSTVPPYESLAQYQPTAAPSMGILPSSLQFPTTLVSFVHESEWGRGSINVIALRGMTFGLEEKSNRNLGHVFAVNSQGFVRSPAGTGPYMAPNASCTGLQPTSNVSSGWLFQPKSSGAYDIMLECGAEIKRIVFENGSLALTSSTSTPVSNSNSGWFVVPVARA